MRRIVFVIFAAISLQVIQAGPKEDLRAAIAKAAVAAKRTGLDRRLEILGTIKIPDSTLAVGVEEKTAAALVVSDEDKDEERQAMLLKDAETPINNSEYPPNLADVENGVSGSEAKILQENPLSQEEFAVPFESFQSKLSGEVKGDPIALQNGRFAESIKQPDVAPEDVSDEAKMVAESVRLSKIYWYYPPSPSKCAGRLYDPIRYFCCDGRLHWKTIYYRYYWYRRQTYADACCCGKPYNSNLQICCKDKLYDIYKVGRGNYIGCCNDEAYDTQKQLCCDGKLFNNDRGCTLRCCGCDAYRSKDALCCDGVVVPRQGDKPMLCCGNEGYHPPTHRCCGGKCAISRRKDERCCGEGVYNLQKEICCGNKAYPRTPNTQCCWNSYGSQLYDTFKEICCDGRVFSRIYGANTRCCSCYYYGSYTTRLYNIATQRCCGCQVHNIPSGPDGALYTGCCCNYNYYYYNRYCPYFPYYYYYPRPYYYHYNYPTCKPFAPTKHSCCNGQILAKFQSPFGCCNQRRYNKNTQLCCNGQVRQRPNKYTVCCGTSTYDYNFETCCYNQVLRKEGAKSACCGYGLYDPKKQSCCNGHVTSGGSGYICCGNRARPSSIYGCCNNRPYYRTRHSCCNGLVVPGGGTRSCCGDKTYDRKTEICCCNCVHPRRNLISDTERCCGKEVYDTQTGVCCLETQCVKRRPSAPGKYDCCYNTVFNLATQQCCNSAVTSKSVPCVA